MSEPVEPEQPDESEPTVVPDSSAVEPTEEEEPEGLSTRDRLSLMGWARSLLLVLALTALILGGLNAWRSEASTTLLITGAVLALFALVAVATGTRSS